MAFKKIGLQPYEPLGRLLFSKKGVVYIRPDSQGKLEAHKNETTVQLNAVVISKPFRSGARCYIKGWRWLEKKTEYGLIMGIVKTYSEEKTVQGRTDSFVEIFNVLEYRLIKAAHKKYLQEINSITNKD